MSTSDNQLELGVDAMQIKKGAKGASSQQDAGSRGKSLTNPMSRLRMIDDDEEEKDDEKKPARDDDSFHSVSEGERADKAPGREAGESRSGARSAKVGDRPLSKGELSSRPEVGSADRSRSRERSRTPDTSVSGESRTDKPKGAKKASPKPAKARESRQDRSTSRSEQPATKRDKSKTPRDQSTQRKDKGVSRSQEVPKRDKKMPARASIPSASPKPRPVRDEVEDRILIDECVARWSQEPRVRMYPNVAGTGLNTPSELVPLAQDVLEKCHTYGSWLNEFSIAHAGTPANIRFVWFRLMEQPLTLVERIAVLQTAFWQTGYSFMNLVPSAVAGSSFRLKELLEIEVEGEAGLVMMLMEVESQAWVEYRLRVPEPTAAEVSARISREAARLRREAGEVRLAPAQRVSPALQPNTETSTERSGSTRSARPGSSDSGPPDHRADWLARSQYLANATARPANPVQSQLVPARVMNPHVPSWSPRENVVQQQTVPAPVAQAARVPPYEELEHAQPPSCYEDSMWSGYAEPRAQEEPARGTTMRTPAAQPAPAPAPVVYMARGSPPEPGRSAPAPAPVAAYVNAHQFPVVRPFIPHGAVEEFNGSGSLSERRKWWERFLYTAKFGWSEDDKCRNLRMFLSGAAEHWYDQLERSERRNWDDLSDAFRAEFCASRDSPAERYYNARQKRHETPREYLWRYNSVAKKARIKLVSPDDLRPHVNRFARTLSDPDTRLALAGRVFSSLKELDVTLKDLEEQAKQSSSRSRSEDRDRSQSRSRMYYAYDSDSQRDTKSGKARPSVHFEESESEYSDSDESDREERVYQAIADKPRDGSRTAGSDWRGSSRAGPPNRSSSPRPGPRGPSPARRDDAKCYECGGAGHWARECPTRVSCALCKQPGHSADKCWKQCPACSQVHAQGQCKIVLALEGLKSWSKTAENQTVAGSLPASVQQFLN